MGTKEAIKLFEEKRVRTAWDDEQGKWYFSIVDVVDVLTDSKDALTVRNESNRHTHSFLLCNSRALSFRRLLLTFHSLIRIFMATPRRYFHSLQ